MYCKLSDGSAITLVQARYTRTDPQIVTTYHVPLTDINGAVPLGLDWQTWTIYGVIANPQSVKWNDVIWLSLDNISWRACRVQATAFPTNLLNQSLYELNVLVSPVLEGAAVRYPTTDYKWGNQSISGISQAGNTTAYPIIHFLAPLFYAPLSNTLIDFTGQAVTFMRTAAKDHAGVTYPINTPIFDAGLYLASDTAQDVATWTPPASTVRSIAMQLKSRYPSPWVIGTGSPANLVTNGEFETNTTGWSGSNVTLSRETGSPLVGTGSLKMVLTANGGYVNCSFICVVGHVYYMTAQVKSTAAAGRLARIHAGAANGPSVDASTQTTATLTFTAVATTAYPVVELMSGVTGEILYIDSVVCYDLTAMNNRNLLTANQSNAETDATGMSCVGGTLTRTTTAGEFYAGVGGFKMVATGNNDLYITSTVAKTPIVAGQFYSFFSYLKSAATKNVKVTIIWFDAAGSLMSSSASNAIAAPAAFTQIGIIGQAPAGATQARADVYLYAAATGEILYVDSLMLEAIPTILTVWTSAHNALWIDTVNNTLGWGDNATTVYLALPAAYLSGTVMDVVVEDDTAHAATIAVHPAGGSWVVGTGTLTLLAWLQLTLGNLEGSIANLVEYPYVLSSAEYQAIVYSSLSLLFNTLYIGNRYAGEIIKGSDKRLLNANGSDISALLGGVDIPIGETANPVNPANLIVNGEFETDTTGWVGASGATISRDTATPLVDAGSLKMVSANNGKYANTALSAIIGHTYYVNGLCKTTAAAGRKAYIQTNGGGGYPVGTAVNCSVSAQTISLTFTALSTLSINLLFSLDAYVAGESLLLDSVVCYDLTHVFTIAQSQGLSSRWYVEVKRTDV